MPARLIGCLWLPHFALRVEIMRHAALDGAPLALTSGAGQRPEVLECSAEAAAVGVRPGMAVREALALCRDLVMVAPDPVLYGQRFEQVLDDLEDVIGPVEPASLGMVFCDVPVSTAQPPLPVGEGWGEGSATSAFGQPSPTGRGRGSGLGEHEDLLAILRAVPAQFRARLGVARGKFVAEAAARQTQPGQVTSVAAGEERAFLAPLPAAWLPVKPDLGRALEHQGLHTLGALSALPFGPVQAQFGAAGGLAWRLARGQDDRAFQPRARALKAEARLQFPSAVASSQGLLAGVERVLVRAFSLPITRGRSVEQITLRAWGDGSAEQNTLTSSPLSSWERTFTLREPAVSAAAALKHLRGRLANAHPEGAVAELGVTLTLMNGPGVVQEELWSGRRRQLHGVAEAARQLRLRFGDAPAGQLYRIMEVEPWSRFPERRWALVDCNF
ncbi:MAG: hypothetical protein ACKVVP_10480 [Chloroflexota bacterium]